MLLRPLLDQGLTKSAIARQLEVSRRTVHHWITTGQLDRDLTGGGPRVRVARPTQLDPCRAIITTRLGTCPELSAVRLFEEVRAAGYPGGITQLRDYVAQVRPRPEPEPIIRFETPPGLQAQVDFAECRFPWGKRFALLVVLGYSRLLWLRFFPRQTMATVIEGLEAAFAYFGGVPAELLFDQMKSVVLEDHRPAGGKLLENAEFLRCAAHHGFRIRACRPYRAQTKGKVERPIGYVRGNLLYGRDFLGEGDLAAQAAHWLEHTANARIHGTTGRIPREAFEGDERATLRPLALGPSAVSRPAPAGTAARRGRGGRRMKSSPSSPRERLRAQLADLKLPGALEALDDILRQVDGGTLAGPAAMEALLGAQISLRNNRRLVAAMRSSRLPAIKTLVDFDFSVQPSLKREQIDSLHMLGFLERRENVVLLGPPGVGKTHLAISLAIAAAQSGRRVYYGTLVDLITSLEDAQQAGRLTQRLKTLIFPSLLVVDEIGYLPISRTGAMLFFQLMSRRYETGATILTSNKGFHEWGDVFGDEVMAGALIDRLVHHCHIVNIRGNSYRMRQHTELYAVLQHHREPPPPPAGRRRRPAREVTTP